MERYTSASLLLISTLFLWEWYTAQPLLDKTLPHLPISSQYVELYIPLSEVIAGYVSLLAILSAFSLYWVIANYKLSLGQVLSLVVCVYMIASGSGMHVGCVIAESNIRDGNMEKESLSALLHFMHEYWSHNTFLFGFFGMMLLASWRDILFVSEITVGEQARSCTQSRNGIQKGSKYKSVAHSGQPSSLSNVTDSTVRNRGRPAHTGHCVNNGAIVDHEQASLDKGHTDSAYTIVYKFLVQWILPLQTGLYFSVFSVQTSTELITAIFFGAILIMFMIAYTKFQSKVHSLLSYVILCHSDLIILGTLVKAAFVGFVTLIVLCTQIRP